jgi:hypothetical protein
MSTYVTNYNLNHPIVEFFIPLQVQHDEQSQWGMNLLPGATLMEKQFDLRIGI